jgi:hypothetical protein
LLVPGETEQRLVSRHLAPQQAKLDEAGEMACELRLVEGVHKPEDADVWGPEASAQASPWGPGSRMQGRPGLGPRREGRSWEAAGPARLRRGVFVSERRALALALI